MSTNEVGTFKEGQEKEITQDLPQKRIDVLDQFGLGELSVDQAVQILAGDPLA